MSYPFCHQETFWDCSLACIYMLSKFFHNLNFDYQKIISKHNYFDDLNLLQMQQIGDQYGISLTPYFVSWKDFIKTKKIFPLILQVKKETKMHFIVVYKKRWKKFLIADPAQDQVEWVTKEKIVKMFNQVVILVKKTIYFDNPNTKINHHFFYQDLLWGFCGVLLMSLGITFLTILLQGILKIIIDQIFIKKIDTNLQIIMWGWSLLFWQKIMWKISFDKIINQISINHKEKWNHKFFHHLQKLKWIDYQKYGIEKIFFYYQKFNEILDFYFPTFIYIINDVIIIFISIIILFFYYHNSIFLLLILIVLFIFINLLIFPWYSKNIEQNIDQQKKFQQHFINFLQNYCDLQNRNLICTKSKKIFSSFKQKKNLFQKNVKWKRIYMIIYELFLWIINFLFIFLLANKINSITPGLFIFVLSLINNIWQKNWSLVNGFFYWKQIKIERKKVLHFLIKKEAKETNLLLKTIDEINVFNLNYSFDSYSWLWKENINLKINKNLFLYGPSGSGKTTFLNILANFLTEYKGKIIVNNQNLSLNNYWKWKNEIYYLKNNSNVFPGTVISNIFCEQKKDHQWQKWQKYQMETILQSFNLTSTTFITNQTLSNGQKQVINFLSLWWCQEKILLLDECLNSIPKEKRAQLVSKLLCENQEKIILYASHDLNLKKHFVDNFCFSKNEY